MPFEDTGFEGWVAQRGPALWRTAWLLTGDAHRAEDLVQTTLVRCWRAWARVEQADAYARRVMVTTYTDWRRRRWTGEVPTAAVGEPTTAGGPAVDGGVAVDVDLRHDVLTALATLPGGQRAVVVLRFYDDLSVTETAAALGVSAGTVKSQTSRAMAALRTCGLLSRPGTEDA